MKKLMHQNQFTKVYKDPNRDAALLIREHFPTPQAIVAAKRQAILKLRKKQSSYPSSTQVALLKDLAVQTVGIKDTHRLQGLVFEQTLLIRELRMVAGNLKGIDEEIQRILHDSREGKILLSIRPMGNIIATTIIAEVGNIENFETAGHLKSFFGWAPMVGQSGTTIDSASLTRGGARVVKSLMYMLAAHAISIDTEWKKIYQRLVMRKCPYDERRRKYTGTKKVIGRIAGQMIKLIYMLLKTDQEVLSNVPPGAIPPEPMLYDPALHKSHREGHYRPRQKTQPDKIAQVVARH